MQVCDKFVSAETPLFTMFFVFFKLPVTKSQTFRSKTYQTQRRERQREEEKTNKIRNILIK